MDVRCANCSAKIVLEMDAPFFSCPFCRSTLFLDRAKTFRRYLLPPSLSPGSARDRLAEEWRRMDLEEPPVLESDQVLLPFWVVRGRESEGPVPAFAPEPPALRGFRLPAASARTDDKTPEGYSVVNCAESASHAWLGVEDEGAWSIFLVPFHRFVLGTQEVRCTAWVEALSGRVYADQLPPSLTSRSSAGFWFVLIGLLMTFFLEALILPSWLALPAVLITGLVLFPFLRGKVEGVKA